MNTQTTRMRITTSATFFVGLVSVLGVSAFTEGRDVRKGDRFHLIDPVPFSAAVISAKGQEQVVIEGFHRIRSGTRVNPVSHQPTPPSLDSQGSEEVWRDNLQVGRRPV